MNSVELLLLVVAGLAIWFWSDSLKAREAGMRAARRACEEEGCQLLDETVVGQLRGFARDDQGVLRLRRAYLFEYSDTGDNRRPGSVTMLGHEVELLQVRPHLYIVPGSHDNLH